MWSPKQRQMIEVYVCLVQRCYREHLARQAALQARLLRVDPKLLLRLHAVWLRRETRAAELLQRSWRATAQTRGGRERLAARRVGHALLHRREEKASSALRAAREREIAELRAVLRLQVTRAPALAPSPSPGPSPGPSAGPDQSPSPSPSRSPSPNPNADGRSRPDAFSSARRPDARRATSRTVCCASSWLGLGLPSP